MRHIWVADKDESESEDKQEQGGGDQDPTGEVALTQIKFKKNRGTNLMEERDQVTFQSL